MRIKLTPLPTTKRKIFQPGVGEICLAMMPVERKNGDMVVVVNKH